MPQMIKSSLDSLSELACILHLMSAFLTKKYFNEETEKNFSNSSGCGISARGNCYCAYFTHLQIPDSKIWRKIYGQENYTRLVLCESFYRTRSSSKPKGIRV